MDLIDAVRTVWDDTAAEDPEVTAEDAISGIRDAEEIDHEEIDFWEEEGTVDAETAQAYRAVLDADDQDITAAISAVSTL